MEINNILQTRKEFSFVLQKHIKDYLDTDSNNYKKNLQKIIDDYKSFRNNFKEIKKEYEETLDDIALKMEEIDETKDQLKNSNVNLNEMQQILFNLKKKATTVKERQSSQSLSHIVSSNTFFNQIESKLVDIFKEDFPASQNYLEKFNQLDESFPELLDYCHKWESRQIFEFNLLCKEAKKTIVLIHKALRITFKLKTIEKGSYSENKEYKALTELCQEISSNIEKFTHNPEIWTNVVFAIMDFPELENFQRLFQRSDFTSLKSKIRIVASIDKTEIMLKIIRNEFRNVEKIFDFRLFDLETHKKEILNLCLQSEEFQSHVVHQWILKSFKDDIDELNILNSIYQKHIWRI